MTVFFVIALAVWLVPAGLLLVGLLVVNARSGTRNPKNWKRCAGNTPDNPAAKTCWVHVEADSDYCEHHHGSDRRVTSG